MSLHSLSIMEASIIRRVGTTSKKLDVGHPTYIPDHSIEVQGLATYYQEPHAFT